MHPDAKQLTRDIRMKLHDIRNHMHLFSGRRAIQERLREELDELFTEAVTRVHEGADLEEVEEILQRIHARWQEYADQGQSMEEAYERIVSIILDTADARETETISLGEMAEREITYCHADLRKLPAEQVVFTQKQAAFVHAAAVPIRRMIQNLLYNAAEAVEQSDEHDGQVEATVDLHGVGEARPGLLGPIQPGTYATLTIWNEGHGLPEDVYEIFREGYSTKDDAEDPELDDDRGLGMAIVRSVLEEYDGNLEITPRGGGDLTVRVYLPAVRPTEEAEKGLAANCGTG